MKKRLPALALLAASVALPGMVSAATTSNLPSLKPGTFAPKFVALHHQQPLTQKVPAAQLPQWNGSYTDLTGRQINFVQIGGNPATTDGTSTITVLLIPIKFVITSSGTKYTFDPANVKLKNNHKRSVVTAMQDSPLFNSNVHFNPQFGSCKPNCVDPGTTQYEDAFQRGTWWGNDVGANPDYHVLYTTKVEKEQTITFSCSGCVVQNPFGSGNVGEYNINTFDGQLQTFMKNLTDVNPGVLPLFISYDIYLTSGGCCIGGYHGADGGAPGGQTYSYATYVDSVGAFSQDVSAFSHELGEWMDDPFTNNRVNCTDNSIMEVGDPLERNANYGGFPYKDKKFTYNLQSLVYMPYFGAPITDSANQWYAFQDDMSHVCPGQ
ncbi:MAG TPA: hypothetical protein VGL35_08770 [Rhizomicrobium sp.]|jgi:hypothetical protein